MLVVITVPTEIQLSIIIIGKCLKRKRSNSIYSS